MYSLLRRRTMMMKPSVVPTERLIYQLNDYTCDGTINTFIDTGIKLFGLEYSSFRIEMEYDGLDLTQVGYATLLECKSFTGGGTFTPGLSIKVSVDTQPSRTDAIATNIYPCVENSYFKNTSSATVILTYSSNSSSINVNGSIKTGSGRIIHSEPLTIGGRYSSHLSNPDRFVQFHISYLRIYAIANENYQYIITPLTFKCITGGDLSIKNANTSYDRNFEYSLNGGAWTAVGLPKNTASQFIVTLSPNDTISFRRDNDNFADAQFISDSNLTFDIYGNLLSLQYGSAFNGQTELRNTSKKAFGAIFSGTNVVDASKLMLTAPILSDNCYIQMFKHCTFLVSAPIIFATTLKNNALYEMFTECYNLVNVQSQLYATTLSITCCYKMFNDCQSLVNAPILPATTLVEGCYETMFRNCYSLTTAPELPATTIANRCYRGMFYGCTSLLEAPELPVTTLKKSCYQNMFRGCTSLTTAPNLPATTLVTECYMQMFFGCTSLIIAPELPAKTLVQECYYNLFKGCSRLNYIKCLATDISASFCLSGWVADISNVGTFVKASGATWPSGNNGIPNGWTVIEE